MKRFICILLLLPFLIGACDNEGPYVKYEAKVEKTGKECHLQTPSFTMESNTLGERYVLEECLGDDFTETNVSVHRKSDTMLVRFADSKGPKTLFKITLDINAYPPYNYLTLGGTTYSIVHSSQ